jgi:hypothetical protein
MSKIIITTCPISTNKDEVFAMCKNDTKLIEAIKIQSVRLKDEGIETFIQKDNIIATDNGYYCAFYEEDLTPNPPIKKYSNF